MLLVGWTLVGHVDSAGFPVTWKVAGGQGIDLVREGQGIDLVREVRN